MPFSILPPIKLSPPDSPVDEKHSREPIRKKQRRPFRRIYVPSELFVSDASLPLPVTTTLARPRYFHIFHSDFHRSCARSITPPELVVFAFIAFTATLGTMLALSRSYNAVRVATDPRDRLYASMELVLLGFAYALGLAFIYWVQRVSLEKMKAAWRKARERRSERLV
ncbi:hypothetical protein K488DRAFT_90258 [Vararia minispora EC-137]|uniref:Uncharacterized protein n=1 Tax=Vararia minispora EC-137 TaxID=1314806 RepID=A0ACB8Q8N4_9AGAM|nr:hypothetical protein K488DRAFT_90258 [Vararia minispora EC-137]